MKTVLTAGLVFTAGALAPAVAQGEDDAQNASEVRPGLTAALKAEPRFLNGKSQDRDAIYAVRPSVSGHAVRQWIRYLAELELAQNPPYLLYGWVDIHPWRELGFKGGSARHAGLAARELWSCEVPVPPGRHGGQLFLG